MPHPVHALNQLARLRGRERSIRLFWGVARLLAVTLTLLALACLVDRWVDEVRETPYGLRLAMSLLQPLVAAGLLYLWVVRPAVRLISDDSLALRVERHRPELGHRLVTAVQLNRETARTEGMSRELITVLTGEAEQLSPRMDFRALADTRPLKRAWLVLGAVPLVLLAFLYLLRFDLSLAGILVQRQLLLDVEIPHHVNLVSRSAELWPAGDEVTLRYEVSFKHEVETERAGTVRIVPVGLPAEEYPLTYAEPIDEHRAIFTCKVPPTTLNFEHRAWLGDGRTRDWARVTFEPRPVVTQFGAWVQLPRFVGTRPDGTPYETLMNQGEVIGLAGSTVRLLLQVSKPVAEAKLVLLERDPSIGVEKPRPAIDLELIREADEQTGAALYGASGTFTLDGSLLAYRLEVKDLNGFANSSPPRRGVALAGDEPPHVSLLPERFAGLGEVATEDTEVEGIPVPLGRNIRIAYAAQSPLGVRAARVVYRVNEGPWNYQPLKRAQATEKSGPFDPRSGAFARSPLEEEVEFAAVPSIDPQEKPGELEAGGRFDFKTRSLKKLTPEKKLAELEVGDRVEFYVEVFDKDPGVKNPGSSETGRSGRSEARIKSIVDNQQFIDWVVQTLQSESRLKQLEEKQKGIFKQ